METQLGSKETPTPVTKATGRRRDTDETRMQHDVDDVAETDATTPGRRAKKGVGSLKEKHRASHGGDGEDSDECNDRRVTTNRDGEEVVNG